MAVSKCQEPHEKRTKIFTATKKEELYLLLGGLRPLRDKWHPGVLANETSEVRRSEVKTHRLALFGWHNTKPHWFCPIFFPR